MARKLRPASSGRRALAAAGRLGPPTSEKLMPAFSKRFPRSITRERPPPRIGPGVRRALEPSIRRARPAGLLLPGPASADPPVRPVVPGILAEAPPVLAFTSLAGGGDPVLEVEQVGPDRADVDQVDRVGRLPRPTLWDSPSRFAHDGRKGYQDWSRRAVPEKVPELPCPTAVIVLP